LAKLLEIQNLNTHFYTSSGVVRAVNGITYDVDEGETVAVVGESGCGKSVSALSILRLIPDPPGRIVDGHIKFQGTDLASLDEEEMRKVRGREIAMIFQEPMTSLNPVLTIGMQLTETIQTHLGLSDEDANARARELLEKVGIGDADRRLKQYPHHLSGGMRQRVMIAVALSCEPKLIIADEPTTALDVTIQAQILELVRDLRREQGMGIIWITHDLGVVAGIADRVIVMYAGQIVEHASVDELFNNPQHPYTQALLAAMPSVNSDRAERLRSIAGQPPSLAKKPASCSFAPRCEQAFDQCRAENPPLNETADNHQVACWLTHPEPVASTSEIKMRESF